MQLPTPNQQSNGDLYLSTGHAGTLRTGVNPLINLDDRNDQGALAQYENSVLVTEEDVKVD